MDMENLLGILTDDEDVLEVINILENPRRRRQKQYRVRQDHMEIWNEDEFVKRFRLSKNTVRFLIEQISNQVASRTARNHAKSPQIMVLVTLRFLATGSFLQVVGDYTGISKASAYKIVHKVCRAIAGLHVNFIITPETEEDMRVTSQQFYNIARFPKCIGALDCTHVKILSPGGEEPETFRNRKGFFSMNIQAICDASGKFENIVCRWPGSSHDSTIFNNSDVRRRFENGAFQNYVLVGDSGYGIRNFFITPLDHPITPAEQLFNESQIRTRNVIERTFGIWKRRFPILAFGIRLKLEKVEAVIIATAVLHNIARLLHEADPPVNEEEEAAVIFVNNIQVQRIGQEILHENNFIRRQLITEYFGNLMGN